jgi:pimeloyl-ACP methyl ester carboxylesterase
MTDPFSADERAPVGWPRPEQHLARRVAQVAGQRMSYVTGGQGEAVILLHGLGASSYAWRHALPVLAQHFTVYAPDMLGCGESDKPTMDYSIVAMTLCVKEFMDAVGVQRAHFIGHSLGGGLTLQFFAHHPERVARVALVSSGGLGRAVHWLLRASTLPGAPGVIRALSDPRTRLPQASRALERRRMRRLQVEFDDAMPTILDRLHMPDTRQAFLSMIRNASDISGQKVSAVPLLSQFDRPVLLLWGARDRTIPVAHGYAAANIMPQAHLEILPACFHRPQIEAPDAFNEQILRFLLADTWPPAQISETTATVAALSWQRLLLARRQSFSQQLRHAMAPHTPLRRLAPAALVAMGIPAGVTLLMNVRTRRQALRRSS